jgi:hypothetical protein
MVDGNSSNRKTEPDCETSRAEQDRIRMEQMCGEPRLRLSTDTEHAGDQLLAFIKSVAASVSDPKILAQIAEAEAKFQQAKDAVNAPLEVGVRDLPTGVLDGRLGDICQRRMRLFPLAYSWPSLLTVASALAPRLTPTKFNLYTALVGPVQSGKTQAIEWAQNILGITEPELLTTMAGSAEGLIKNRLSCIGAPRLLSPDELAHLFSKAQILNASFFTLLCRAFYHDKFELVLGRGVVATYHASLSILGGIVDVKYEDLFSSASTAGTYDRFLHCQCPAGFLYDYVPFYDGQEELSPSAVYIDDDVWIEKAAWLREEPEMSARVAELAIRAAAVSASFDRRHVLTAKDLGPARELARYQTRIRRKLKPNPGENFEGKVAHKILDVLDQYKGKFISKRELFHAINYTRYGPSIAERAYLVLLANDEIEETKVGRIKLVRRAAPEGQNSPIVLPPEAE